MGQEEVAGTPTRGSVRRMLGGVSVQANQCRTAAMLHVEINRYRAAG